MRSAAVLATQHQNTPGATRQGALALLLVLAASLGRADVVTVPTQGGGGGAGGTLTGPVTCADDISPAQLTADQNNYSPTGLATACVVRLDGDSSLRIITGLATGSDGRELILRNVGSNTVLLKNESTASTAANRFAFGGYDLPLFPSGQVELVYDATLSRWSATTPFGRLVPPAHYGYYNRVFFVNVTGVLGDIWGAENNSGAGADCATSTTAITTAHPYGYVFCETGTTATGRAHLGFSAGSSTVLFGGGVYWRSEAMLNIPVLSDGTETYTLAMGFYDAVGGPATAADGCYFRYTHSENSGQWVLACRSNSVETVTNSSSAVAAATFYRLTIIIHPLASVAEFFLNGTSLGTVSSNVPSGAAARAAGQTSVTILKSVGTVTRGVDIEYMETVGYHASRN